MATIGDLKDGFCLLLHGQKSSSRHAALSAMLDPKGRAFDLIQVLHIFVLFLTSSLWKLAQQDIWITIEISLSTGQGKTFGKVWPESCKHGHWALDCPLSKGNQAAHPKCERSNRKSTKSKKFLKSVKNWCGQLTWKLNEAISSKIWIESKQIKTNENQWHF